MQKDPDIVSQEISLFGAYGKFGWSLPQKRIFLKHFIMMIRKLTKLVFMSRRKFSHVRAIENFAIEEIFCWVVGWREMLLTFLIFFKTKNNIL